MGIWFHYSEFISVFITSKTKRIITSRETELFIPLHVLFCDVTFCLLASVYRDLTPFRQDKTHIFLS